MLKICLEDGLELTINVTSYSPIIPATRFNPAEGGDFEYTVLEDVELTDAQEECNYLAFEAYEKQLKEMWSDY